MRILISAAMVLSMAALGAEKKVNMQDLPPAVQAAVKEQTKTSTLVGLTREVEDGKTLYEAETKANGHGRDISFDSTGAVVSVEEEVPLDSIPAAAKAAIDKQASEARSPKWRPSLRARPSTTRQSSRKKANPLSSPLMLPASQ
jgi:hypothetical protein